jgi:hypothetical protein
VVTNVSEERITYIFRVEKLHTEDGGDTFLRNDGSAPSQFPGVTFFKTPANGKSAMREVTTLWEKLG